MYGDVVTDADRLQVVINCMHQAGIETLGDLLQLLFRRAPFFDQESVSKTVNNFVSGNTTFPQNRPESIFFDLILQHPHATHANSPPPSFNVPRFALPPSERLLQHAPVAPARQTTHNAIMTRLLSVVLSQIDIEAHSLISWQAILPPQLSKLTWTRVLSWDMTGTQEHIARQARVIFSTLSALAVGHTMRKKLDAIDAAHRTDVDASSGGGPRGTRTVLTPQMMSTGSSSHHRCSRRRSSGPMAYGCIKLKMIHR
ncbi:hypothetical protein BDZ89DRAFT_180814 [Hymenopellis radicata]|nr:hypothetical protein BDZ89DRAFT_180814 [Hymenopellis radicata]